MSLHSHDRNAPVSRRTCLRWAGASLVAAVSPAVVRAGCPCGDETISKDAAPAQPPATQPARVLRVCADPNNLPFSNRSHEGFEDKIAALVAHDLGLDLQYDWLPQRLGFYRTALKTFDSNLVMAAPGGFDKALITDPYYRSTYVFVCRRDHGPKIRSLDDPALRSVKIGVPLSGGDNTPPTHALARRKLIDNITGYPVFDESEGKPGERIIAAVASGEIDVAVAWGPPAAYFARRQSVPLDVVPVSPAEDHEGDAILPFSFNICMAVRRNEKPLRDQINACIARRREQIDAILDDYGIPRLPIQRPTARAESHSGAVEAKEEHERDGPPRKGN